MSCEEGFCELDAEKNTMNMKYQDRLVGWYGCSREWICQLLTSVYLLVSCFFLESV